MGIATKADDIENQKRLIVAYCIQLVNKFSGFQGTENPDKFKDAVEFEENTLGQAMNDLSEMDMPEYRAMLDSKDYERVEQTKYDILSNPSYYHQILMAMGEEWLKHETGIFGIDYDKLQKKAGKKPKWL